MNKNKLIKRILLLIFILIILCLVGYMFYDLFIESKLVKYIKFKHNVDNRKDVISFIQMASTILFSGATVVLAYITLKLQKQSNEVQNQRKKEEKMQRVNKVYGLLRKIINEIGNVEFNVSDFIKNTDIKDKIYEELYILKTTILNESEYDYLENLIDKRNNIRDYRDLKILYKKIIDLNISPDKIYEYNQGNMIEKIISPQMLLILWKLRMSMNDNKNLKVDNNDINIDIKTTKNKDLELTKKYSDKLYIKIDNQGINGIVEKYEPIFIGGPNEKDKFKIIFEMVYKGNIKNYLYEGDGEYYYYTKQGFENNINSYDLNVKGVNYDYNAQFIKSKLEEMKLKVESKCTLKGNFKKGKFQKGTLIYKETSNSNEIKYEVENLEDVQN